MAGTAAHVLRAGDDSAGTVHDVPTALLSVYDKAGVTDLARDLAALGWTLVSSGGTATAIESAGISVTDVADLTGVPAILGHRVVTLHPKVHGGILADPTDPEHTADMAAHDITPIDLVVVNLYPFGSDPSIELIDIGGPAMVRAAAKNHAHVGVVVDPKHYRKVVEELTEGGVLSASTRAHLARDAFAHTAAYDAAIVTWFDSPEGPVHAADPAMSDATDRLPATIHFALERAQPLRYGENPHQQGARYRSIGTTGWWDSIIVHGGKALSYLNLYDTSAAWRLVNRFDEPACVVVKHANPCGVAVAASIEEAYHRAHHCDPVSAFGGIVSANQVVNGAMAGELVNVFTEVVVAPDFTDEALEILGSKKNLRILQAQEPGEWRFDVRPVDGGMLIQEPDPIEGRSPDWEVVTETQPTGEMWDDLQFAWTVCAATSSNAIVYAKDRQAVGIGAGQQNRLDSARLAGERADGRARGGAAASDAFFPFRDGLDAAAAAGVAAVIQPGGSVRDEEVIAAADEHGIAMVFTGQRHFRH